MDKSNVAVEESHWRNESPVSASKSLGSLVKINSIAIDLSCAMEEIESPLHEHFSIRGFVAGMREKDSKTCLPFSAQGVNDDLVDNLPPLSVPKFRWWQCSTCVPDFAAESTGLEMVLADKSVAGTSSCQHVDRGKEVLFSNSRRNIGDEHVLREPIDGEDNEPSNKMTNGDPKYKDHKATTSGKEKMDVGNDECGTSYAHITKANTDQVVERNNNNADMIDAPVPENPSIGFDEPDDVSFVGDAAGCALPRRRKPKLRSLADIMEEENNSMSEHIKMRSALSSGMQATSTEKEDDSHRHSELETSADVATVTRIPPHRKRKFAAEEDRGPPQATNPPGTAKRSKGPIPDSDKRRRMLELSDSESGGDGSAQSDFAKTQQNKPRRNKALGIKRKMKQTHGDNGTVPIRDSPMTNSMFLENVQRHSAPVKTSGNMENVPPTTRREMESYLNNLTSGKQVDRTSDKSKSKRPEVEVDLRPVMPPRKSSGDYNFQGKVALELSLNTCTDAERNLNNEISCRQSRGIPDLNESFTEKSSATQWKQLLTSENRSSTLHKNLDMDTSSSKQMAGEGKRQFGVSEPQAVQKIHSNVESAGTSDDIPMDIVELLAKNQRDRTLDNSRNHLLTSTTNNSARGSSPVYVDGRPGVLDFPLTNTRRGISVTSGETELSNGILSFPQAKNCQLEKGSMEENQFRYFSSFKPCQSKKTQYSASNSLSAGPRPGEGADLLWPPRRKNVPFHLDVRQNRSVQHNIQTLRGQSYKWKNAAEMNIESRRAALEASAMKEGQHNGLDMQSFPGQSYKGKTATEMNSLSRRAARDASAVKEGQHNGLDMQSFQGQSYKWKNAAEMNIESRISAHEVSAVKEGRIGSSTKSAGSMDAYSNDTIPAMQLLSLMDRGIVSGSSFKVGSNSFHDKPFSPCNHHPRLNVNEKQSDPFLNGPLFSQGSRSNKDFPALHNGVRFPGETSKRKLYAQGHMLPPRGNNKSSNPDNSITVASQPSRGDVETQICTLNRNPADFSIPDAKNEYTITARDLKLRRRISLKERSRGVNLEGLKRGRARKDASGGEYSRK